MEPEAFKRGKSVKNAAGDSAERASGQAALDGSESAAGGFSRGGRHRP